MYDELRCLAEFHLRRERRAHAFDPTDLVSETYLRLAGANLEFSDRGHFFAIASRIMNQILIDHARKHLAVKRGSGEHPVELTDTHVATDPPRELVALNAALDELVRSDHRKGKVTVLHYYGGLTHGEIAAMCGIHTNTVSRDLHDSTEWLRYRLET